MNLEEKIQQITNVTSDINEHIPTLIKYGAECDHITEMGVRGIISTWAFVAANPKHLICYDIQHPQRFGGDLTQVENECLKHMIEFNFTEVNVLDVEIESTDLLFIDTWHAYKQLKAELKLHSPKVNKYIILHDTTTFADRDETSYEAWGSEWVGDQQGLWKCIEEFVHSNPEWIIHERFTNNNGLTILKKQ